MENPESGFRKTQDVGDTLKKRPEGPQLSMSEQYSEAASKG